MADPIAQPAQTFEQALSELQQALEAEGLPPEEAVQVAQEAVSQPRPQYAHKPEVGAGGYGLPYMPPLPPVARNALGDAETSSDPVLDIVNRAGRAEKYRQAFGVEHDAPMTLDNLGLTISHAIKAPQVAMIPAAKFPRATAAAVGLTAGGMLPTEAGSSENEEIKTLQQQLRAYGYKGPIDGVMGPGTAEAKARFDAAQQAKEQQAIERQKAEALARGADAEARKAQAELDRIAFEKAEAERKASERKAGDERFKQMEDEVPMWRRLWRDYGPTAAYVAGGVGGALMRGKNVTAANKLSEDKAMEASRVMSGAPVGVPVGPTDVATRFPPVNEFWRRGGASEVPFPAAPGTRAGIQSNPNAPQANALFPQGGQFTGQDAKYLAAFGGDVGLGMWGQSLANAELAAATEAAAKDPSEVNLRRLQVAKDLATAAKFATNLGYGLGAGYGLTAAKGGRDTTVPNTTMAQSERAAIDQFLRTANNPRGGKGGGMATPVAPKPQGQQSDMPDGHWNYQKREKGSFAGPPKYPKGHPKNP